MKINNIRMDFQNNVLEVVFDSNQDLQTAYRKLVEASDIDRGREIDENILRLCNAGNVIEAIKYYRTQTNFPLREAKNYVDKLRGYEPPR